MAISKRAGFDGWQATAASTTLNISWTNQGALPGDIVLLFVGNGEDSPVPSITTPPSGFTELGSLAGFDYGTGGLYTHCYYRIVQSGDANNVNITWNTGASAGGGVYGTALVYQTSVGWDNTPVVLLSSGNSEVSGTSSAPAPPDFNTGRDETFIVHFLQVADDTNPSTFTTANGFSHIASATTTVGSDSAMGAAQRTTVATQATISHPVWSLAAAEHYAWRTIGLREPLGPKIPIGQGSLSIGSGSTIYDQFNSSGVENITAHTAESGHTWTSNPPSGTVFPQLQGDGTLQPSAVSSTAIGLIQSYALAIGDTVHLDVSVTNDTANRSVGILVALQQPGSGYDCLFLDFYNTSTTRQVRAGYILNAGVNPVTTQAAEVTSLSITRKTNTTYDFFYNGVYLTTLDRDSYGIGTGESVGLTCFASATLSGSKVLAYRSSSPPTVLAVAAGAVAVDSASLSIQGQAPTIPVFIVASAGAATFAGLAPSLGISYTFSLPAGAATLAGLAPSLGISYTFSLPAGVATFAGLTPSLITSYKLSVPVGAATLTGLTPSISGISIAEPAAGSISVVGQAPSLNLAYNLGVSAGAATFAGLAPSLGISYTFSLPAGAATLAGLAPTDASSEFEQPGAGAATFAGLAPSLGISYTFRLPAGAATLAGLAPTDAASEFEQPGAGVATFAGQIPSLGISYSFSLPAGSATLTGRTPTLEGTLLTEPAAAVLTLAGQAPTLGISYSFSLPAGSATLAGLSPTLVRAHIVQPTAGSATLAGQAPISKLGLVQTPESAFMAFSGAAPTLSLNNLLQPSAGALAGTGQAPSLGISYSFSLPAGSATLEGRTPSLEGTTLFEPAAGAAMFVGQVPILGISYSFSLPAGSAILAGQTPDISINLLMQPAAGAATFAGQIPSLGISYSFSLPAGSATLNEQPPTINVGTVVQPAAGALAISGTGVSQSLSIGVPVGELIAEGRTPTQAGQNLAETGRAVGVVTGLSPVLSIGNEIRLPAGTVTLTGNSVIIHVEAALSPQVAAHEIQGESPTLSIGFVVQAGVGTLTYVGKKPVPVGPYNSKARRWNGTTWEVVTFKIWTGTRWEAKPMACWTGTEWKIL